MLTGLILDPPLPSMGVGGPDDAWEAVEAKDPIHPPSRHPLAAGSDAAPLGTGVGNAPGGDRVAGVSENPSHRQIERRDRRHRASGRRGRSRAPELPLPRPQRRRLPPASAIPAGGAPRSGPHGGGGAPPRGAPPREGRHRGDGPHRQLGAGRRLPGPPWTSAPGDGAQPAGFPLRSVRPGQTSGGRRFLPVEGRGPVPADPGAAQRRDRRDPLRSANPRGGDRGPVLRSSRADAGRAGRPRPRGGRPGRPAGDRDGTGRPLPHHDPPAHPRGPELRPPGGSPVGERVDQPGSRATDPQEPGAMGLVP